MKNGPPGSWKTYVVCKKTAYFGEYLYLLWNQGKKTQVALYKNRTKLSRSKLVLCGDILTGHRMKNLLLNFEYLLLLSF